MTTRMVIGSIRAWSLRSDNGGTSESDWGRRLVAVVASVGYTLAIYQFGTGILLWEKEWGTPFLMRVIYFTLFLTLGWFLRVCFRNDQGEPSHVRIIKQWSMYKFRRLIEPLFGIIMFSSTSENPISFLFMLIILFWIDVLAVSSFQVMCYRFAGIFVDNPINWSGHDD